MKLSDGYYLDENQGQDGDGMAYGYIGRTVGGQDYQGWFFTWPSDEATITRAAHRQQMLASLEIAKEEWHCKPRIISHRRAHAILNQYLRSIRLR